MSLYAIPSLLALVIKAWLFIFARKSLTKENKSLGCLLLSMFIMNYSEFHLFRFVDSPDGAIHYMLFYWVGAIATVASLICFCGKLSGINVYYRFQFILAASLCCLVLFTPLLIAGTESINYSVTRIKGDYYWILQLYVLSGLAFSLLMLLTSGIKAKSKRQRQRCIVVFFGFAPTVMAVFIVLALMYFGFHINATVIVSFTITFFLIVLIYTEDRHNLFKLLSVVPRTRENLLVKRRARLFKDALSAIHREEGVNLKHVIKNLESNLIEIALEHTEGNQTKAAKILNIAKSNVSQKLRAFERSDQ